MLRHIYRGVLRLHPPGFRRRFGDELLSIFDQAKGRLSAFRLLMDSILSLIRQWTLRPEFWNDSVSAPARQGALDGMPSFCTLSPFRPRTAAVIPALILSLAVFSLTCVAIKYSWIRVLHVRIPEVQFAAPQWTPPNAVPTDFSGRTTQRVTQNQGLTASLPNVPAQTPEAGSGKATQHSKVLETARTFSESEPQAAAAQPLTNTKPAALAEDSKLDAAARHRVVDGAAVIVSKYYVDADVAHKMAIAIREHENNGDDNSATDG